MIFPFKGVIFRFQFQPLIFSGCNHLKKMPLCSGWIKSPNMFFPQQQNAKGSLHNIDFGVFWASWGGSGKELGSGNRFRVTGFAVPGTSSGNRLRVMMVPTGFGVPRFRVQFSGNRVLDRRHCQGFGFRRLRARGFVR